MRRIIKALIITCFITFIFSSIYSQDIEWQNNYGDDITNQYCQSLIQCPDSGFLFLGRTILLPSGVSNIYLVKTDRFGDFIWSKIYGHEHDLDIGYDIQNTSDSGFIICGTTTYNTAGSYDAYILKTNAVGDTLWTKTYGGYYADQATCITQTYDGGFCFAGQANTAYPRSRVTRIDSEGNELWIWEIGGDASTSAWIEDIQQCSDSGFIVAGAINTTSTGSFLNTLLVRLTKTGALLWQKQFHGISGIEYNSAHSVCQSSDGGFAITGCEYTEPAGKSNLLILKTNEDGDSLWANIYGDTLGACGISIDITIDDGFILSGDSEDMHILKTDSLGEIMWTVTIDEGPDESVRYISQTYDGGYILGADTRETPEETINMFGLKFASMIPRISTFQINGNNNFDHIIGQIPEFSWSIISPYIGIHDSIEIDVGIDNDWFVAEMWQAGVIPSTNTFITYSGNPLIDGVTYFFRIKVAENDFWSPWYETPFRMNSLPSMPTQDSPLDNIIIANNQPILTVQNSGDDEGDVLTYDFEVYDALPTRALVASASDVPEGTGTTSWTVDIPLTENQQFFWRARAFDQYEYSDWSEYEAFWVNVTEEPPTEFQVNSPPDETIYEMLPEFIWEASTDPDPFDTINYTLEIAIDENFLYKNEISNILLNCHTLPDTDSLLFGIEYWWKVIATDKTDVSTASTNFLHFTTWMLGDVNDDRGVDILDIVYLLNALYKEGDNPDPIFSGDINGDCAVNILDVVHLINYKYKSGPEPEIGCE